MESVQIWAKRASVYRVGAWLPSDKTFLTNFLNKVIEENENALKKPLHPVIRGFDRFIKENAEIYMLFNKMFSEVPYDRSPTDKPQVKNYNHMLRLLNIILTKAPEFNKTGLVGFPINAILDWSMGTEGGFAAFIREDVNAHFKRILEQWAIFLSSKDSCSVLNKTPKGWLGKDAMKAMPDFKKEFKCNPAKPHWGFKSWDDFFTREFREGQRRVASPNDDSVIVNACEAAPYRLDRAVKISRRAKFWMKGQPYSLQHMLNNDRLMSQFIGGTVYQAFLSALSYHRWHSPISGTVIKAYVIEGTYYSQTPAVGFDDAGPNESQGYITEVATRALIFIEADNPDIGLMCFMAVGMAEVSTCDIRVYEGQKVKKGDEIGMFHFGGSTHCLIFRNGVELKFDLRGQTPGLDTKNIPVRSKIATIVKRRRKSGN